jgi:predicted Fe-S protein YdhL (DUF1289 family)
MMTVEDYEKNITIPTPCRSVCRLKDNLCTGCGRTIEEISIWGSASNEVKLAILERTRDYPLRSSSRKDQQLNG